MVPLGRALMIWAVGAVAMFSFGFIKGREAPMRQLAALQAIIESAVDRNAATEQKYRQLEQEVSHAQEAHVAAWRAARSQSDAEWLRLKQDAARRTGAGPTGVPGVCPEPGGHEAHLGDRVEAAGPAGDRDIARDLVTALSTGEELEARLALAQAELLKCQKVTRGERP